jgi:hypothetical protein
MLRGFDSFQGLPAHEDTTDNIWHKGQFAATEAEGHVPPDVEIDGHLPIAL